MTRAVEQHERPPAARGAEAWAALLRRALAGPGAQGRGRDGGAAETTGGRQAAVLVPIILEAEPHILLTRRADHLRHHGGQVSFPGGRIEPQDPSPEAAALREAWEEVGLDPDRVEVIGRLPRRATGTGFIVTPVVGLLPPGLGLRADAMEVAAILSLPLAVLLDLRHPSPRRIRLASGETREDWVWPHEEHQIWGATAAILLTLAERLRADGA